MNRKKLAALAVAVLLLGGGGYAGTQYYLDNIKLPEVSPRLVVEHYFAALEKGEFKRAYDMVSHEHYFESLNQFTDRVSMYAPDMMLEVRGERLEEKAAVVEIHIVVPMRFGTYSSDTEMSLIRAKREWKILHP